MSKEPRTRPSAPPPFTDADITRQRLMRDKAIIAIHLLREKRAPGTKGVGANREDHPIFRQVVNLWLERDRRGITGTLSPEELELIEQARARVTKYERQIMRSQYGGEVMDPLLHRFTMLESVREAYKQTAQRELVEALKEEIYGGW